MKLPSLLIVILFALFSISAQAATCIGATPCHACKTCNYCAHCAQQGGHCGVKREKVKSNVVNESARKAVSRFASANVR
jgi:hypothetical protein